MTFLSSPLLSLGCLLSAIVSFSYCVFGSSAIFSAQYCIVGAGPGGIQLGHFLEGAGRDYIIFESKSTAGSFFHKFPRQRTLISINKRFRGNAINYPHRTRSENFAMRHDWNSLLGNTTKPMTERTRELYPHADVLYEYFRDFAQNLRILYNTTVKRVASSAAKRSEETTRDPSYNISGNRVSGGRFHVLIERQHNAQTWLCENVIVANGLHIPQKPRFLDGEEHIMDYVDLPTNGSWADGKRVLVLGFGNAALETAKSIQNWATETTVYGRPQELPSPWREGSPRKGLRFSFHTHYVGDMRQVNLNIMDMYQLKSLDGFLYMPDVKDNYATSVFSTSSGILHIFDNSHYCVDPKDQEISLRSADGKCPSGMTLYIKVSPSVEDIFVLKEFEQAVSNVSVSGESSSPKARKSNVPAVLYELRTTRMTPEKYTMSADISKKKDERISKYAAGGTRASYQVFVRLDLMRKYRRIVDLVSSLLRKKGGNDPLRFGIHSIVRCFGWLPDKSLYSKDAMPTYGKLGKLKKYPETTPVFESVNIQNLWFAGSLTHGRDFRKAAGGFIHGFRYNARATFRAMEWRYHGVHWPYELIVLANPCRMPIIDNVVPANSSAQLRAENDEDIKRIADWLEQRANNGDGTYQMFDQLTDACVFFEAGLYSRVTSTHEELDGNMDKGNKLPAHVKCMEELPKDFVIEKFGDRPRVTLQFVYGENHHGPKVFEYGAVGAKDGRFAERSSFLHPKLMFWSGEGGFNHVNSTLNLHLVEDVPLSYNSNQHRPFLIRFIEMILSRVHWPSESMCGSYSPGYGSATKNYVRMGEPVDNDSAATSKFSKIELEKADYFSEPEHYGYSTSGGVLLELLDEGSQKFLLEQFHKGLIYDFKSLDVNENGVIVPSELNITKLLWERLFLDDSIGSLEASAVAIKIIAGSISQLKSKGNFSTQISQAKYSAWVNNVTLHFAMDAEETPPASGSISDPMLRKELANAAQIMRGLLISDGELSTGPQTDLIVTALIQFFDLNQNGGLEEQEFITMMRKFGNFHDNTEPPTNDGYVFSSSEHDN